MTEEGTLQPHIKFKFFVEFNFDGKKHLQEVERMNRPELVYYNDVSRNLAKNYKWEPLTVDSKMTDELSEFIQHQMTIQMDAIETGGNCTFDIISKCGDPNTDEIVEQWNIKGCFLQSVTYNDISCFSDETNIEMVIRFNYAFQGVDQTDVDRFDYAMKII